MNEEGAAEDRGRRSLFIPRDRAYSKRNDTGDGNELDMIRYDAIEVTILGGR